jgi:type I restriction enzyme, S subunit
VSFPCYPTYKPGGVEWLREVPAHWGFKRLKRITSHNDEVLDESTDPDKEIVYVDISGVDAVAGIVNREPMLFSAAPSRARRRVRHGDVIISTVRTYLRAIARVREPEANLIVSTGFAVIRPKGALNAAFLGYLLSAQFFVDQVIARSTGVSYPAINASDLVGVAVPVPPPEEQAHVAAFLDAETTKIDALVAEQQRLLELLKDKRHAVVSRAVTRGLDPTAAMKPSGIDWLGEVPASWEVTRIANVFREVVEPGSDELPILTVSIHHGVSDDEVDEEDMERKVTRSDDRSKYKRVAPGDLAYNMMRAWQGGFGAVTVPGMISPAYVVARPKRPVETAFFEKLLRTPKAIEQMRRHSRGITDFRLRLYWDEFKNIRIAVPPIEEQRAILAEISRMEQRFDALANEAQKAIGLLQERRAALISAAVTGQIDVRDLSARTAA